MDDVGGETDAPPSRLIYDSARTSADWAERAADVGRISFRSHDRLAATDRRDCHAIRDDVASRVIGNVDEPQHVWRRDRT
ncbi:MAG: hypothetical protein RL743_1441 [Actinomycetota bacterium]